MAVAVRLAAFYGVYFTYAGVMAPFWPVWLAGRGIGPAEVGLILAAGQWLRVATGPAIAALTDRWGRRRRMMLTLALTAFVLYALCNTAIGFWALLPLSAMAASATGALLPIGETVTLAHAYRDRLDYGRIRLWGSLSFIAAATVVGYGVKLGGIDVALLAVLSALAATVLVSLALPRPPSRPATQRRGFGAIVGNRPLLAFALCAGLIQASHAMFYGFASLHWRGRGIDGTEIGLLWAAGVIAETVLFSFSGRVVGRLGIVGLLRLAAAAGLLRWVCFAADPGLPWLFPLMTLHALTFGATHLATMHAITRLAPPESAATAQALYSAGTGVLMGLGASLCGFLYEAIGTGGYLAMAALAVVAGTVTLRLVEPRIDA